MAEKSWKENRFWRTMRRGLAVMITSGLASLGVYLIDLPEDEKTIYIIFVTTLVLMGEKYIREYYQEKKK